MRNKARPIPEGGLDWHLQVAATEWPAAVAKPDGALLVIASGPVIEAMASPPVANDLVVIDAALDTSRPDTVRAHTLRRSHP